MPKSKGKRRPKAQARQGRSPRNGGQGPVAVLMQKAIQAHRAGRLEEAQEGYRKVLQLAPGHAQATHFLGVVHRASGRPRRAVELMRHALRKLPNEPALHSNLARALRECGELGAAVEHFHRAVALNPDFGEAWSMLCNALREADRLEEAVSAGLRAAELSGKAEAWMNLGNAYRGLGEMDLAEDAYLKAIEVDPTSEESLYNLSELRTFEPGDPLVDRMERLYAATRSEGRSSEQLSFALAKIRYDLKDYTGAFELWTEGNRLRRQAVFPTYRVEGDLTLMRRIAAAFDAATMSAHREAGFEGDRPIFILGMPRSGTTLVEQILSSHPEVEGAGELEYIRRLVQEEAGRSRQRYPEWVREPDAGPRLRAVGERYVEHVRARFPDAPRVTDKMPPNFFHAGLIKLALPRAKIIHTRRDPLDTCLSCFTKRFTEGNAFSYDLETLGRFYRGYEDLMAHWREVLPEEDFLEIDYEDMVDDFEAQVRRLLHFCELPWNEACLRFFETERAVQTASATQVRSPIYRSSIGRAEREFGQSLAPLKRALEQATGALAPPGA